MTKKKKETGRVNESMRNVAYFVFLKVVKTSVKRNKELT